MQDPAEIDRQNAARLAEIETEIKNQPLTSLKRPVQDLAASYQTATAGNFMAGITALQKSYKQIRVVRGDGNCYYRAFLYQLAETMFVNPQEATRILEWFKKESWEQVLKSGYDEMTVETFYDTLVDLLERLATGKTDAAAFHDEMNQEGATSDYCTWYLRVVTATYLKQDAARFLPFLDPPVHDMASFCQREVEPMGKECQHVQVLALAEAVGCHVKIEYLDGHDLIGNRLVQHAFGPDTAATHLTLLYRPGHYDILYPL